MPKPQPESKTQPKPESKSSVKSSNPDTYDLAVIGAGPGGYAAAFHAASKGMRVALIDTESAPGGVCLHRGCIPSKALLHAARLINEAREAAEWGIEFDSPRIDVAALRGWKNRIVEKLTGGVAELGKRHGVEWIQARAKFADSRTLELFPVAPNGGAQPNRPLHEGDTRRLRFKHAILATGSLPAIPRNLQVNHRRVWDSTRALELDDVPPTLLIVGAGYIGLEMGTVYAALGSAVTVVEMTGGILPGVDRDLTRPLHEQIKKQFKAIELNSRVERLETQASGIEAQIAGEGTLREESFDAVLIAVGRRPNTENLGLENTEVHRNERGFIEVNASRRTADSRIYAIGDAAGEPMLAHKASREGKVAVDAIAGEHGVFDSLAIPAVVFTDPEIAWCGLTENEAKAAKREIKVARFPWAASGRALTLGRTEGVTKLIIDPETERILGMGIVGVGAGEMIAEGVLAVEMGAVARDLADSIHPHPTLTETVMESAESFYGEATHIYRPRK